MNSRLNTYSGTGMAVTAALLAYSLWDNTGKGIYLLIMTCSILVTCCLLASLLCAVKR